MFYLGIFLILLSGISDGARDSILAYDGLSGLGDWWSFNGWRRKWKITGFLYKNLLVFLTDAWHMLKYVYNLSIIIGSSLIIFNSGGNFIWYMLLILIIYLISFNITFYTIKKFKTKIKK